jgi:hypothetical protein
MALNPNHTFEDVGEKKCSIVEKNCTPERVDFLKRILEYNKFEVVVARSPAPKPAKPAPAKPAAPAAEGEIAPPPAPVAEAPAPPETFTVGVTDLTFSPVNAVFNRELKTPSGKIVTNAYWKQLESEPNDEEWYWAK